jgi:hypothetical protein
MFIIMEVPDRGKPETTRMVFPRSFFGEVVPNIFFSIDIYGSKQITD